MSQALPKLLPALGLLAAAALLPSPLAATIPEGWFAWPAREPVAGSALDASDLNEAPAGKLGRVRVQDGHFVSGDGSRLRFWGANLGAAECFPDADGARLIATRLARGGVNIARLHHLDNGWGIGTGGSLWRKGRKDMGDFDPAQLDRLHRLIAELKAAGIYSNLNLKVSKTLTEADGFPASVAQVPDFQKRVDIFQRRMIDLQKDYARHLLTSRNPYTGLSLVEDPAIAVVEINNENSLLGFWTRDLGRGTHRFAEPFRSELAALWNKWLASQYPDDASLAAAWGTDTGKLGAALSPSLPDWHLGAQRGSTLARARDKETGLEVLTLAHTTGTDWHTQASLGDFKLQDGVAYTVEIEAAADKPRDINVVMGLSPDTEAGQPWRSMGLYDPVKLDTTLRVHRVSFVAHSVGTGGARLSLNIGQADGQIRIRSVRVSTGSLGGGLLAGQAPRTGTVPIPQEAGSRQWADWLAFLAHTERSFAEEMRSFLKDELHVQAPIVCSQIDYGGLTGMNREQSMDFADSHSYWQHPDFAATGMWDPTQWTIRNSPMLAELAERHFAELGTLAMTRVAGKPFTVSEYDHPAPSEYVCEMYPLLATFGSRQDWDGLYPFAIEAYSHGDKGDVIRGFFDQHHHPAKWGFSPAASRLFRQTLVAPAPAAVLSLPSPLWSESPHADILWRKLLPEGRIEFLNTAFGVSDRPLAPGAHASLRPAATPPSQPLVLATTPRGKVYTADSPQAAVLVGFLGGQSSAAGPLTVDCAPFGRGYASVMAVSLDGRPLGSSSRILLTVAARAENQDMGWNALRTSVGKNWGTGPVMAERVPARFSLRTDGPRRVHVLAPDGSRARAVAAEHRDGVLSWAVSAGDRTLHYEVTPP
jgi:hypothetical protein